MKSLRSKIVLLLILHISTIVSPKICITQDSTGKNIFETIKEWPIESYFFTDFRNNLLITPTSNHFQKHSYSELKLQWDLSYYLGLTEWKLKNDFIYDNYLKKFRLDLREANIWIPTWSWLDIKVGRQILTWGKGDLVFINDLFPKDWQSFFIGREIEYLKAPSDALKLSINTKVVQINFVYTPQFDPDRYLSGERMAFGIPGVNIPFNQESILPVSIPNDFFRNAEYAIRLQRNFGKLDLSLYGYIGYWKSPSGFTDTEFLFPGLSTYGLSVESNFLKGIIAVELGHYISTDDSSGENPFIRNSDFRYLVSYSRDLKKDWNIGIQYYSEITLQYERLIASIPLSSNIPSKVLNQLSVRLGKRMFKQKLHLNLITFYSFSGKDSYVRPNISYRLTDKIKADIGGNIFIAQNSNSFWGQFNGNDNLYLGIKYNF